MILLMAAGRGDLQGAPRTYMNKKYIRNSMKRLRFCFFLRFIPALKSTTPPVTSVDAFSCNSFLYLYNFHHCRH